MLEHFNFSNKVVIVTGGATGIGAACAEMFAQLGAKLVIASRNMERLSAKAAFIKQQYNTDCLPLECDVRDEAAVQNMVAQTLQHFGRIDVLVNNAGGTHMRPIESIDAARWHRSFAINVDAAFYCTQAVGKFFRQQGGGSIVNISSMAGEKGTLNGAAYSSAKAALQMFTRVCAAEWGPLGIRINCVAPGMILSDIAKEHLTASGIDIEAGIKSFPLQRAGTPEDVAQAVIFLASSAASYITGETICINGGPQLGGNRKES